MSAFRPNLAQTQPTNHATAETANCIAQGPRFGGGYCPVATTTPTNTLTPTPVQVVVPTATATPELVEPTPIPVCWLTNPDTGDPSTGFIAFDENGRPIPCPTAFDDPIAYPTDVVIATDIPTPVFTPTLLAVAPVTAPQASAPQASAPQSPAPQPQIVYVPATPQIVTVVITATPIPSTPTPTPTRISTATPTRTLTLVPTLEPTATMASLAQPTPVVDVQENTPPSNSWLSGPMGIVLIIASVIGGPALVIFGLHFWNNR